MKSLNLHTLFCRETGAAWNERPQPHEIRAWAIETYGPVIPRDVLVRNFLAKNESAAPKFGVSAQEIAALIPSEGVSVDAYPLVSVTAGIRTLAHA